MGRSSGVVLAVVAVGSAIFLGVLLASPSPSGPPPGAVELRPGTSVPRHLKAQVTEVFVIRLREHDFLRVVVEQQGIDVVVSLLDPAGRELFTTDRLNRDSGLEPVEIIATASGWHSLRVRSLDPTASGRYTVRIEERRRENAGDEERERASRAFARGEALLGAEDFVRAREEYRAAFEDWKTARYVRGMADARARLGAVADASSTLEETRRSYREAAKLYGQLGDREEIALLIEVGKLSRLLSEPGAAEADYLRALRMARRRGERSLEAEALSNLGVLYESEKPGQALAANDKALEAWRSLGDRAQEASTLHNLGTTYTVLGRLPQALKVLEDARKLRHGAGDQRGLAATLTAIAWVQSLDGQHAEALSLYDDAIRLRRLAEDRIGEAVTLDRRGTTLVRMERMAEALKDYDQALEIFRQGGERRRQGPTLANLGSLYVTTGSLEQGERLLNKALHLLEKSGDRHGMAHVLLGLAHAARQRGNIDLALTHAEAANAMVESLRAEAPGMDLRLSYSALRYGYRELWIDILMDLHARQPGAGWDVQALEASERGRARGLLESFGQDAAAGGRSDATLRTLEIRKLESLLLQPLEGGVPPEQIDEVERKLSVLLLERDWRRNERPVSPAASRRPILQEIRELLGPDTLLLEYAVGEEESFLWLVGADGLESWTLPGRAELEAQVLRARTRLSSGYRGDLQKPTQTALADLGRTLIGPVADHLGDKRLLIVPDGVLHEVPFSALTVEPGGAPLVVGHEIAFAPSAFAVVRIRRELAQRPSLPGDLALLADPVFAADDARMQPGLPAAPALPSLRGSGPRAWKRLEHTKSEAEAITRLLPPSAKWVAALGFEADREAVLGGLLNGYRIIHFATHAHLNPEQPELSSIVLTMVDPSGQPREGHLRSYEIRELSLPADLVVLSACSTGLGRELRGEGPLGLSRSFLDAGAARVLVSLWDVEDKATAELMRRFYRALLVDHLPAASALRQAQLSMRNETRWSAPYWAGFVLQGEWR